MNLSDLKGMLRVFRLDLLSHYQWASWLATVAAICAMAAARYGFAAPLDLTAAAGMVAAVVTAGALAVLSEWADQRANAAAVAAGQSPTRSVDPKDRLAALLGAVPVALPLLALVLA